MRSESLLAEKGVIAAAEARASQEAAELSRERFRLAADLEAARKAHSERETELVAEAARLRQEERRLAAEFNEAQRELATARGRADGAARAAEASQADGLRRLQILDQELKEVRDALASAQQRATAAEARAELLQEAVRKAEEKAARLEITNASKASTATATAGRDGLLLRKKLESFCHCCTPSPMIHFVICPLQS
jgi:DNA repair exonuclease SbcCD ATPase subunit